MTIDITPALDGDVEAIGVFLRDAELPTDGLREQTVTARDFFEHLGFVEIPRASVPASVQQSVEFTIHGCGSATVMRKQ